MKKKKTRGKRRSLKEKIEKMSEAQLLQKLDKLKSKISYLESWQDRMADAAKAVQHSNQTSQEVGEKM